VPVSFVMSVNQSDVSTKLPLDGFFVKFDTGNFY